ncbi:hypothetical protein VNO77_19863 [Canavalia gladiata]|uniref:Uncharacterized protein n=1 Tax=Canavalia gladiata TaxID=3824 RepID=A0AAN9LNH5_CANGL
MFFNNDHLRTLLGNVSQSSSQGQLAITAVKFLATVSTSVHHTLFSNEGVVPQIFQCIVIANVKLREDDEELFERNYIEFIRKDIEGSDLDTGRKIAYKLLKGIATHYGDAARSIVSAQIQTWLSSLAANPVENWKENDCATYLVVSLATKRLCLHGTCGCSDFFFESVISPERQNPDVNGYPMLKSNVVHSYATSYIEKILLVKDEVGRACYTSTDINPIFPMLMNNLFGALKLQESKENQYAMKFIMGVLGVASLSVEVARVCIEGLPWVPSGLLWTWTKDGGGA